MSKQLRKLIWKHFWKQKSKELKEFYEGYSWELIAASIIIPIILQIFGWGLYSATSIKFFAFLAIFGLVILGGWALYLILYLMFYSTIVSLYKWLNSNWKLARNNAEAELRKMGRRNEKK